jgi:hypothetical protein
MSQDEENIWRIAGTLALQTVGEGINNGDNCND